MRVDQLAIVVISILIISCASHQNINKRIQQVMKDQERSWSSGDLEGFMEGYWKSDSLVFVGRRGLTHGWETTLANYKKSYPNSDIMGELSFSIKKIESLGKNHALVIGSYTLLRSNLDNATGYFTTVWRKIDGDWRIVADQSN